MSNKHMVLVDAGALQMVRNALKRDAESGNQARAEMLDELDKATTPQDRAAFDLVAEASRILCDALKHSPAGGARGVRLVVAGSDARLTVAAAQRRCRGRRLLEGD